MKGIAQQTRTKNATTRSARGARVQTKRRDGAGNRHRADVLECQAEEIAARIMRGETNLGGRITRTDAAGHRVYGSAGRPLPLSVRDKMETALGADLSAVRVHVGTAADSAAREYNAEAFASGRDVYFRSGRYSPYSTPGCHLIAHELVHVLQQAGRRSNDDRLVVTAVSGTAEVQRVERDPLPRKVPASIELDELSRRHRAVLGLDMFATSLFDTLVESVRKITGDTLSASVDGAPLANRAMVDGEWDSITTPKVHREFVADALRALEQDAAVAHLLTIDPRMKATLHSEAAVVLFVGAMGKTWISGQIGREPFGEYFPSQFVDTYRRYLFGPTRAIQALYATKGEFIPRINQIWDDSNAGTARVENELYFFAMFLMRLLDNDRMAHMTRRRKDVDTTLSSAPEGVRRMRMAQLLFDDIKAIQAPSDGSMGLDFGVLYARVIPDILKVCEQAKTTWEMAILDQHVEARKTRLAPIAAGSEGVALRKSLVDIATKLLERPEGELPGADAYSAKVTAAKKSLKAFAYENYEAKLIDLSRRDWNADMALWYAAVLYTLDELKTVLEEYKLKDDKAFLNGLPDIRVAHRIRVAGWYARFAPVFGWDDLATIPRQVLTAQQPGQTDNEVAITGGWELDNKTQIADLAGEEKGFPPLSPIIGLGGLTALDISHVFLAEYYTEYAGKIDAILQAEGSDFSQIRARIVPRARQAMADFKRPRRYVLTPGNYYLAEAPAAHASDGSVLPSDRSTPMFLVMDHDVTKKYIQDDLGAVFGHTEMKEDAPFVIGPSYGPGFGQPFYFWTVPPLKPLVDRLQDIEELDKLVKAQIAADEAAAAEAVYEEEPAEQAADDSITFEDEEIVAGPVSDWFVWLRTFLEIGKEDPARLADFRDLISDNLGTAMSDASRNLLEKKRTAEAHDRQLLLKFRVRPLLEAYNYIGVDTFMNPSNALRFMEDFAFSVEPENDGDEHLAAMVLELLAGDSGEVIRDKFKTFDRFDLIITWLSVINRARRMAKDSPALLMPVLVAGEDSAWIEGLIPRLDEVIKAMEERQKTAQLLTGFIARPPGQETEFSLLHGNQTVQRPAVLEDTISGRRMNSGERFTINGVEWQLVEVKQEFEFHPDWGNPGDPDSYQPSIIRIGDKLIPADEKGKRTDTTELLVVTRDGVREVITAADPNNRLEELSNAIGMQALVQSMAELQEFLETYVDIILSAAEFIPGAGQALMIARLVASLLQFVASDEFAEIRDTVINNPQAYIDELGEMVQGAQFDAVNIAEWMLFHGNVPDKLGSLTGKSSKATKRPKPTHKPKQGTLARFAGIISRLTKVGSGLYRSVDRVKDRAARGVMGMETYVHTRPAALAAVNIASDYISLLPEAKKQIEKMAKEGMVDVAAAFSRFPETVDNLVSSLNEMEIPREIVPMGELLGIVVELVLDRLGAKYKIAGRGILFAIEKLGYREQLFDALAEQIPDKMNPNTYWAQFVDETLTPRLDGFRTELVGGLNATFKDLGLPQIGEGQVKPVALVPSGETFSEEPVMPAASPKLAEEDDEPAPYFGPLPSVAGGAPLGRSLRSRMESDFGHDFAHVRLHTGNNARQMTGRFHADAVASGSHVFLRPGLRPDSGRGNMVLRHELSHVLQQTGSRPLGQPNPAMPTAGAPQRGLEVSNTAEDAADRMAAASLGGSEGAVPVEEEKTYGAQPAFGIDTIGRLLRRISRGEALQEHYERILKGAPVAADLPQEIDTEVANVHTALVGCYAVEAKFIVDKPFSQARTQIVAYMNRVFSETALRQDVKRIALESLIPKELPAGATSAQQQKPEYELSARSFQLGLEGLFLAGGLAVDISLDTTGIGAAARIKPGDPVQSIKLLTIDMAGVQDTTLWDLFLANSFPNATDRARLGPRTRAYLAAKGPVPGIWDGNKFELSFVTIKTLNNYAPASDSVDPKVLPAPGEYLNPSSGTTIGLLTGTHQQLSGPLAGVERESHHTTQFLLLEYFRNWKSDKPFKWIPSTKADLPHVYPGLSLSDDLPGAFQPPAGNAIDIASMTGKKKDDRGPGMPAVSLSRITHRLGRVHMHGEPDELKVGAKSSPSGAVQNHFREGLEDAKLDHAMFSAGDDTDLRASVKADPGNVQTRIHAAMQYTYTWMRDEMMNRLKTGLQDQEVEYYNFLAAPAGANAPPVGSALKSSDMGAVMDRVKLNNKTVMEDTYRWK